MAQLPDRALDSAQRQKPAPARTRGDEFFALDHGLRGHPKGKAEVVTRRSHEFQRCKWFSINAMACPAGPVLTHRFC